MQVPHEAMVFYIKKHTATNMRIHTRIHRWPAIQMERSLKSKKQYINALHCNTTISRSRARSMHIQDTKVSVTTCLIYNITSPIAEHLGSQESKQPVTWGIKELRCTSSLHLPACLPAYRRAWIIWSCLTAPQSVRRTFVYHNFDFCQQPKGSKVSI